MSKTKLLTFILIIGIPLFSICQEKENIELKLLCNQNEEFSLQIINNTNKNINAPLVEYQDFFSCFDNPCVNFIGEIKKNGKWIDLKEIKSTIIDFTYNVAPKYVQIKPGEVKTMTLGYFKFPKGIDTWFGLYGNQKIRFSANYIFDTNKDEIDIPETSNRSSLNLISNKIELDYIDNNSQESTDYNSRWVFQRYGFMANIKNSDIEKGAVVIDRPKNGEDALIKGLSHNKFKIEKWNLISSFFSYSKEKVPFRVTYFESGSKKYYAISTQKYRFDENDTSGKYVFNLIETEIP